jgi:hypothetical protein
LFYLTAQKYAPINTKMMNDRRANYLQGAMECFVQGSFLPLVVAAFYNLVQDPMMQQFDLSDTVCFRFVWQTIAVNQLSWL